MHKQKVCSKLFVCAREPSWTSMVPMLLIHSKGFQSHVYVLPNLLGHTLKAIQSVVRVLFLVCG
jgi:hypothetical protein